MVAPGSGPAWQSAAGWWPAQPGVAAEGVGQGQVWGMGRRHGAVGMRGAGEKAVQDHKAKLDGVGGRTSSVPDLGFELNPGLPLCWVPRTRPPLHRLSGWAERDEGHRSFTV
jgi:hypothetical protein